MNLELAIKSASIELKRNKIKSPYLDSEILMSKAINKDREFIILNLKKEIKENDYIVFKNLVQERLKGKPIAYLTGRKNFWKYEFYINQNVLY